MIDEYFGRRKHVWHYDTKNIPSEDDVEEICKTAYSLSTSKQKAFPFKLYVLGPNLDRSHRLWTFAEGNKIITDYNMYGTTTDSEVYRPNPGLSHMKTAPYTFIVTPRVSAPNPHYRYQFKSTASKWELEDPDFVDDENREAAAIEIGLLAKSMEFAALDKGLDISYNICFTKNLKEWQEIAQIRFKPMLMITLGKATKYFYERFKADGSLANDPKYNTSPDFNEIFEFVDC